MSTSETTEGVLARWAPSRDSAAAFLTELGMIAAYAILGGNSGNLGVAALIGLIVVPVLAVGIPVYWTTKVERQPISMLGITSTDTRCVWPHSGQTPLTLPVRL